MPKQEMRLPPTKRKPSTSRTVQPMTKRKAPRRSLPKTQAEIPPQQLTRLKPLTLQAQQPFRLQALPEPASKPPPVTERERRMRNKRTQTARRNAAQMQKRGDKRGAMPVLLADRRAYNR